MHFAAQILLSIVGSVVARVLISLGMGVVIYRGASALNGALISQISSLQSSLPVDVSLMLSRFGFFSALSIVISAWVASLSLAGIIDGARRLTMTTASS